eukprot:UN28004
MTFRNVSFSRLCSDCSTHQYKAFARYFIYLLESSLGHMKYDLLPRSPPRKFRSFGKSLNSYNPGRRPAASGSGPKARYEKKYLSSYIFKQFFKFFMM